MNKCEVAKYFEVSRVTVNDWCRRGCPIGSDGQMEVGAVAEWKARRDLKAEGITGGDFPRLWGELSRRFYGLEGPIKFVNELPAEAQGEPGLIKAAIVHGLVLERALLELPLAVLNDPRPGTFPEVLMRNIFEKLDAIKGGDDEEGDDADAETDQR